MSDSEDFNKNNGNAIVDNREEDKEAPDAFIPDVSVFGESTGMADAVLVVEGVRIPVIKVQLFFMCTMWTITLSITKLQS